MHIITSLEVGGATKNTLHTVANLNRERFEVSLVHGAEGYLVNETKNIKNLKSYCAKYLIRSIHIFKDVLCLFELAKIIRECKPDIVHTHSSKAGILGRIAAYISNTPIIIHTIHGFGFNPYQNPITRKLFILLEKWAAKINQILIAVCEDNVRVGLALGIGSKKKYRLIRSGVDLQGIRDQLKNSNVADLKKKFLIPFNSKVVTSIAALKTQKNPFGFIRIAKDIEQQVKESQFLMVGDGNLRLETEKNIKIAGLENKIKILGWIENIPDILAVSDVIVMTSLWEGLPRVAIEACAAGKPMVAFAINGLCELLKNGENGFLIEPNNYTKMADKIISILKDDNCIHRLMLNCQSSIDESFDINKMIQQQEKLYIETFSQSAHE
ncbi:MAG: hypothetical protein A3I11_04120 [Elusimicrobia bacterium RIFCSPLOWO2_02_FULL_39_32]|nr:MAG: hypothetical protein A2034_05520 [Elusimicrobia bacterium GWA2_38_7]OGR79560.1 MAG: hypothetical protein A3B80_02695 [Elusimicrobia bacterium RIFCSPHIGHO2_02_FULL_39_36]OGR92886.1 MAG: hypothetical protein A3I11_04120 [Elusimicrobia bacterium RIFCSPLOWO2_02_FULL_39_32]